MLDPLNPPPSFGPPFGAPTGKAVEVIALNLQYRLALCLYDGWTVEVCVPLTNGYGVDGSDLGLDDHGLFAVVGGCDELGWFWVELADYAVGWVQ